MGRRRAAKPPAVDLAPAEVEGDGLTAIRTTINPHEVIRVGAAELLDLERQGLIHAREDEDEAPADDEAPEGNGEGTDPLAGDPATDDEREDNDE